jgi:hypothetical protein
MPIQGLNAAKPIQSDLRRRRTSLEVRRAGNNSHSVLTETAKPQVRGAGKTALFSQCGGFWLNSRVGTQSSVPDDGNDGGADDRKDRDGPDEGEHLHDRTGSATVHRATGRRVRPAKAAPVSGLFRGGSKAAQP